MECRYGRRGFLGLLGIAGTAFLAGLTGCSSSPVDGAAGNGFALGPAGAGTAGRAPRRHRCVPARRTGGGDEPGLVAHNCCDLGRYPHRLHVKRERCRNGASRHAAPHHRHRGFLHEREGVLPRRRPAGSHPYRDDDGCGELRNRSESPVVIGVLYRRSAAAAPIDVASVVPTRIVEFRKIRRAR